MITNNEDFTECPATTPVDENPFVLKPKFNSNASIDLQLARIINECSMLDREVSVKAKMLDSKKEEIKGMLVQGFIAKGKYVTKLGYTMALTTPDKYDELDSQEVFEYLLENNKGFSFKDMFSVGVTKLRALIGEKADAFRKKNGVTLKISFK